MIRQAFENTKSLEVKSLAEINARFLVDIHR